MSNELKVVEQTEITQVTPMSMIKEGMQQDNVDVGKMEKLWELQQQYEATQARKAFVSAMAKFREECPAIIKTKQAHNSKYAGLAETLAQIKVIESECGLSHSWRTDSKGGTVEVTCVVTHSQGHSEQTTLIADPDKSGSKNSIQAIGSSVTYLQRYTLFSLLGLASSEDDIDGANTSLDLDEVISLFESAKTLAKLDSLANHAAKLPKADKAKAKEAYTKRKRELSA